MRATGESDRQHWQRVDEVFNAVIETPPRERAARLDALCGSYDTLRADVTRLLESDGHVDIGFLQPPAAVRLDSSPTPLGAGTDFLPIQERPGTVIGPYTLHEQIGEGGFGVVYLADQQKPIRRRVALKVIKPGMDTRQVISRFQAERQALALMDHPHIARVLDGGETESGRPYFVMELVKGIPITDYCDQCNLTTRQRLELFVPVCQAVQHAHQKGIIHRDLKPSNVMIAMQDGHPAPKVIDFGVAKAINQRLTEHTLYTQFAQMVGTPLYMSPEQAEMSPLEVDTRSDIYSLGAMLYELLTGTTPFERERLKQASFDDVRRIIRQEVPPTPSTRLSTLGDRSGAVAQHRRTDPRKLHQLVRGDLDWIVMKALEKDRTRRYDTASGFAADVQCYLDDEPVQARPPSVGYRWRKFVRRHKVGVALAAAFLVLVTASSVVSTVLWRQAAAAQIEQNRERQRAEQAARIAETARQAEAEQRRQADEQRRLAEASAAKARKVTEYIQNMLGSADPYNAMKGPDYTVREMLDEVAKGLGEQLKGEPETEIVIRVTIGRAYVTLARHEDATTHLEIALALAEQVSSDEMIAEVLEAMAWAASGRNDFGAAEEMFHRSLDIWRRRRGPQSEPVAWCLANLSEMNRGLGRLDEAEEFAREALSISKLFGEEHGHIAWALCVLARALNAKGDYAAAESLFRDALEMRRRLKAEDRMDASWDLRDLGQLLSAKGDHAAAEPLLRQALAVRRRLLGDEHPYTTGGLRDLAWVLSNKGEFAEAEALYREALAVNRKVLGDEHLDTASALYDLATVLHGRGDVAEAEALLREELARSRKFLGDGHPLTLDHLRNLSKVRYADGDFAEAEALLREGLATAREELGDEHELVGRLLGMLGETLLKARKYDDAEPVLRECLAFRQQAFPDGHANVWSRHCAVQMLGGALAGQAAALVETDAQAAAELLAEAEPMLLEGYDGMKDDPRVPDPSRNLGFDNLGEALERIVQLYEAWDAAEPGMGYDAEAEALFRQALARSQKLLGDGHPQTLEHLLHLSIVRYAEGDFTEAEALLREGLATAREELGDEHELVGRLLGMLGETLLKARRFDEAEPVLRECLTLRRQLFPDGHPSVWWRHCAVQMLGGALAGQAAELAETDVQGAAELFAEAESMLLDGYNGMKDDPHVPHPSRDLGFDNLGESLERIVQLYESWDAAEPGQGHDAQAAEWRAELEQWRDRTHHTETPAPP